MYNLDLLKEELKRDEGVRYDAYKDSVGLWTIGVGHLLGRFKTEDHIGDDQLNHYLDIDITNAAHVLEETHTDWTNLDDVRQRALLNMAFNLGHHLLTFMHFLNAVSLRDWVRAGSEMSTSKWAKQVGVRADRLRHMIETGEV